MHKFREMLDKADRIGLWSYVDLKPWCIPHVLLLLADFGSDAGRFHFSLVRTGRLSAVWAGGRPVSLVRLAADGSRFEVPNGGPNPRPILEDDVPDVPPAWATKLLPRLRSVRRDLRLPDR